MADKTIVELVARSVDAASLATMLQVPELKDIIEEDIKNQHSWFERIRIALGYNLEYDMKTNWHQVYNILEDIQNGNPFRVEGAMNKAENGFNLTALRFLLELGYDASEDAHSLLRSAGRYGSVEAIRLLLTDERIGSRFHPADYILLEAAYQGRAEIVRELLTYPIVTLSTVLRLASGQGHEEVVRLLLQSNHPTLDTAALNKSLLAAVGENRASVVTLLLKDKRSDPSIIPEELMQVAAVSNWQTVNVLLQDKRVRVTKKGVLTATKNTDSRVLELLLSKLRGRGLADSSFMRELFRTACKNGSVVNVELLLNDPEVNVTAYDSAAFLDAVEVHDIPIVELLLEDGRSDPAAKSNAALKEAIASLNVGLVSVLLEDSRVDIYGEEVCRFLLSPESDLDQARVITRLLMSDYRAFQDVPSYIVDYARANIHSKGHYDRLLREILIMRLDIGYYYTWLIEQQSNKSIGVPSRILVKSAAYSLLSKKPAKHNSEYFTAYRGFLMLGIARPTSRGFRRPDAATIVEILRTEEGVTDSGIRRAEMLMYSLEAAQK